MEHIGLVVKMLVSGNRGRLFKSRHQYVGSLSKTLYLHCFSRLSCKMSTRWGQPRVQCYELFGGIALKITIFILFLFCFKLTNLPIFVNNKSASTSVN